MFRREGEIGSMNEKSRNFKDVIVYGDVDVVLFSGESYRRWEN